MYLKITACFEVRALTLCLLTEISQCAGGSLGRGIAVLDAGHLEQLLGDGGGDDACSAGRGDEPHPNGAALAGHLGGHGVRLAELVAPEAPPHRHDGQLGQDDGAPEERGQVSDFRDLNSLSEQSFSLINQDTD